MIYLISDLHLGHSNIIRFSNRPFESVEHMNDSLVQNWNSVVSDQDTVYHLGDFCFNTNTARKYLQQLKGNKIFLKGNHDFKVRGLPFLDDSVHMLRWEGHQFLLFHYPIEGWGSRNIIHVHGHVHGRMPFHNRKRRFNVSCEVINYTPISIEEVVKASLQDEDSNWSVDQRTNCDGEGVVGENSPE